MIARTVLALALGLGIVRADASDGGAEYLDISIEASPIANFKVRSDQTRFGDVEFVGGLEIDSPDRILGGISAIRLLDQGSGFVGVMDTGLWFTGQFSRDSEGRLAAVSDLRISPVRDARGRVIRGPQTDAEGLALNGEYAYVSFERQHRIERFRLKDLPGPVPVDRIKHLIPDHEFRNNKGMEAISIAPAGTPLDGALVVVSERSLDKKGDMFAAIVDGPEKGVFFVRRHAPYDVTDGDFLPNGDLLLLERRFSIAGGVGMRIRRIAGADIAAGETVDGPVLLEADFGHQIDNMESLDVFTAADGSTRVLLASDDNHSLLQRTIVLEFRLVE